MARKTTSLYCTYFFYCSSNFPKVNMHLMIPNWTGWWRERNSSASFKDTLHYLLSPLHYVHLRAWENQSAQLTISQHVCKWAKGGKNHCPPELSGWKVRQTRTVKQSSVSIRGSYSLCAHNDHKGKGTKTVLQTFFWTCVLQSCQTNTSQ